jgi:transcription elongation factor Elf1
MPYTYDLLNNTLKADEAELPLDNLEQNLIGTCSKCNADVVSISYHLQDDKIVVAARCSACGCMYAILYNKYWIWLEEHSLQETASSSCQGPSAPNALGEENAQPSEELLALQAIPFKKLETVFTQAEIKTLFAKASGKKYVRQYLYRARKKYPELREIFDIYLNI